MFIPTPPGPVAAPGCTGTGGAARAIAHALWDEGFTLIIAGRDVAKAQEIAAAFNPADTHVCTLETFAAPIDFEHAGRKKVLDSFVSAG